MLLKQFTLAHYYPEGSRISAIVEKIREVCLPVSPNAKKPKLGNFTTLLPPFRAHIDEMENFVTGLTIARALYEGNKRGPNFAETQSIDFFRNPGVDTLILRLALSENYHAMIEAYRNELCKFNEWVFPIFGNTYIPHICILEGPGLYEDLEAKRLELKRSLPIHRFRLPFPTIMVKVVENGTTRWEEFDPSK